MKGKDICEEMKRIRKEIAKRNNIDYIPAECTHEGNCAVVCPTCEREAAYIMEELEKRAEAGLPVDWDYNLASRMKVLEAERMRSETSDIALVSQGIIPDPDLLTGMQELAVADILEGDVAAPEWWGEETEEKEDVDDVDDCV